MVIRKKRQAGSRKLFYIISNILLHMEHKSILKYSLDFCVLFHNLLIYLSVNFKNKWTILTFGIWVFLPIFSNVSFASYIDLLG